MLHEMKLNKIHKNQNKIFIGSPYENTSNSLQDMHSGLYILGKSIYGANGQMTIFSSTHLGTAVGGGAHACR